MEVEDMEEKVKKRRSRIRIMQAIMFGIIMFLFFQVKDFVGVIFTKGDVYEIRREMPLGVSNGQEINVLYINGENYGDADVNEYMLLDENGETDLKYCALMHQAKKLSYSILLGAMLIVAIVIANSAIDASPFTHKNANRIRLIGVLQFALAIVPGLVRFLMCFFKFQYVNAELDVNGFYMFAIAFAIMTLAQVFDYGVKLQEDIDSIA